MNFSHFQASPVSWWALSLQVTYRIFVFLLSGTHWVWLELLLWVVWKLFPAIRRTYLLLYHWRKWRIPFPNCYLTTDSQGRVPPNQILPFQDETFRGPVLSRSCEDDQQLQWGRECYVMSGLCLFITYLLVPSWSRLNAGFKHHWLGYCW